jgi:hypothetical protein
MSSRSKAGRWSRFCCDSRCLTVFAFVLSILFVGAGGFFLGIVFAHPLGMSGGPERATAVIEEAKRRIPVPNPPPKPAGHTVTESKVVTINVPRVSWKSITMDVQQVTIPTTKLVGATPEETAKWQGEADKQQADYEKRLAGESKKIANEMFVNDWRSTVTLFTAFSKEVAIPFLGGLAGLVGAIAALMRAFRTKPDAAT